MFSEGSAQTLQVLQNAFRGVSAHFADVQNVFRGVGADFASVAKCPPRGQRAFCRRAKRPPRGRRAFCTFFKGDYQLLSAGLTFHTSKAQHTDKKAAPIQNQLIAVKS